MQRSDRFIQKEWVKNDSFENLLIDAKDNYAVERKITNKMIRREKGPCENLIIVELEIKRYNPNIIFNINGNIKKRY